jgi:septal ring factor EnvC (AmiA/AmiB activator)
MQHRVALIMTAALLAVVAGGRSDAQMHTKPLSAAQQQDLDALSAQRRADERKTEATRQTARQVGEEIEELRRRIVDISKHQGVSETRSAIYRAKLETLNLQEADITRRLSLMRAKEARLLSALQIYSRNPPPAILIAPRRANDAVLAAIIMRAITPELQKRTRVLYDENARLVNIRRQAALQNEALFITEQDVSQQRSEIEKLIEQKMALEDQLLGQADQLQAHAVELKAREARMRGDLPLRGLLGFAPDDRSHLEAPVVGDKISDFGQNGGGLATRGVTFATAPGSQVTAPAEGEVEYAGPIESYGWVVILNVGRNYRVVLTGMDKAYVEKGRTVARHEPLGRMPNLSDKKTTLYMELRRGEDPINPSSSILAAN